MPISLLSRQKTKPPSVRDLNAKYFFSCLEDFSNGGWYGGEHRQNGYKYPHLLRADYHSQDLYYSALYHMAQQLLKSAYKDNHHTELHPEVDRIISAYGLEVRNAFDTLFIVCKSYNEAVEKTPISVGAYGVSGYSKHITREKHGISQEQSDQLQHALLKIWQAYPRCDARINEGVDYVMSDPFSVKTFTFPAHIGGIIGYCFASPTNEDRSDYRLEEMLESYDGHCLTRMDAFERVIDISPNEVAAIAAQTTENLNKLQELSIPIAVRCIEHLLKATCIEGNSSHRANAIQISDNLASGQTTIDTEAAKIRNGYYDRLTGQFQRWIRPFDANCRQVQIMSGRAENYLEFCMDVYSGRWFEQNRKAIAQLCAKKGLPGYDSTPHASHAPLPLPA